MVLKTRIRASSLRLISAKFNHNLYVVNTANSFLGSSAIINILSCDEIVSAPNREMFALLYFSDVLK